MNSFFDKIYCYGLNDEIEREKSCIKQFKEAGIDVTLYDAVDNRGEGFNDLGVRLPHIGINRTLVDILERSIDEGLENVLIFQNDVILSGDATNVFNENIKYLPEDWDFLSLGCFNYFPPHILKGRINKSKAIVMDHAISVSSKSFKIYIDELKKESCPSDMAICNLIKNKNLKAFSFVPYIAHQGEFFSSSTLRIEKPKECD